MNSRQSKLSFQVLNDGIMGGTTGATIELLERTLDRQRVQKRRGHCDQAEIDASDLRAGAGLVLAGLAARGRTRVYGIRHIDCGYENLVNKLAAVGASIWREDASGKRVEGDAPWASD